MTKLFIPVALKTAFTSLLTRKLFFGMAISCVVGIGLGAWLEPPKFHFASAATTVTLPQEQPDPWSGDATSVSSRPYDQPAADPNWTQTAAVSPPAAAEPIHLAQADESEVAASGDTSPSQGGQSDADDSPTPARQASPPSAEAPADTGG